MAIATHTRTRVLGVFTLSMISISAIIALQGLPSLAKNGSAVISILIIAALLFFIPIAFACAELASGWPRGGGIYTWVKEAFGEQAGTLTIWLEWIGGSVVWLPTILSFIASSIAYSIHPPLANNPYYMFLSMLILLWSVTLFNFFGMKTSGWFSTVGIVIGTLLPALVIISLGLLWFMSDQPVHIQFNLDALFPDYSFSSLSYLAAVALGFAGVEVAAFYIQDTKDPARTFPRATFISAILIIVIYLLGALTIASIIPTEEMDLSAGMMAAMHKLFDFLHIPWATSLFALFSSIGGLALLNTWSVGPSQGLLSSALNNNFPKFMQRTNRQGSPVAILLMQGGLGTLLVSAYLFTPTLDQFYWIFQTQTAQLLLVMYLMVFLSVIKLRYTQPNVARPYKIPGGKIGLWICMGGGALFCIFAFALGFIPPEEYDFLNEQTYPMILLIGFILFCTPPFLWQWWRIRRNQKEAQAILT